MAVADLISNAQGYAATVTSAANSAMSAAASAANAIPIFNISYTPATIPPVPALPTLQSPQMDTVNLDLPADPGDAPQFQDIAALDAGFIPVLGASAPSVNLPNQPVSLPTFGKVTPLINTSLAFPSAPSLVAPVEPVFAEHTIPTAPAVSLPAFTAVAPTDNTVAPTNLSGTFGTEYATAAPSMVAMANGYVDAMLAKMNPQYHTQMSAIEAQLSKYLAGGTGLNAAVENAIYERARYKNDAEARRVRDAALNDAAARGFTLPTGALTSAMQQARQAGADSNAQAAREIVVMQAEMEQKNLQFAVTTSAALRNSVLNATIAYMQNLTTINGQALDYAKSILNAVVETYNIAAKAFGVKLEAYKTEAQVYEVKMRGAMAGIEIYTAEIKALEAMVNVDRTKVEVYRAKVESLTVYQNLYRSQIDAVLGKAQLEKLKLDVFQAEVQAYQAQVQAKNAEWQGYTAAIEGETAKVKAYGEQVAAYSAQVTGYQATVQAKAEQVKATAATNQARAAQFAASMEGYKALVEAKGAVARTELENQRQRITAFQAETTAQVASYTAQVENFKASAQIAIENAKLAIQTMLSTAESTRSHGKAVADVATANANVLAHMAGSAMAGINSLAAEMKYE